MLFIGKYGNSKSRDLVGRARAFARATFAIALLAFGMLNTTGSASLAGAEEPVAKENENATQKERIPTTDNVSHAMQEIRTIVRNNHSLVTHRRLGVTQAHAMNSQIKAQIKAIRAGNGGSKLLKTLTPILKNIETGAAAIAEPTEKLSRMDGLFQVDEALHDYGQVVVDDNWESLRKQ